VSVAGHQTDGLNRQVQRNRVKPLHGEQIPENEVSVLIAGQEKSVFNNESAYPVGDGLGGQPTTVEAVDMDGMDVSAVPGKYHLTLPGKSEMRDCEVETGVGRNKSPEIVSFLDSVDVDGSVLRSGHGQVKIDGQGDAGDGFVVAAQDLKLKIILFCFAITTQGN
jgi:hypothetical protein